MKAINPTSLILCRGNKLPLAGIVHLKGELSRLDRELRQRAAGIKSWQQRTPRESWHISYTNGVRLNAMVYLQKKDGVSHKWAVIVHGYGGEGRLMLYCAKPFYKKGYNLLIPDLQAHGTSGGKYIGWGIRDSQDIRNWCRCILHRDPKAKIVLYGVSMGGVSVLMASKKPLKGLVCTVADSAYSSLRGIFTYRIANLHLPVGLTMGLLEPVCENKAHIRLDNRQIIEAVSHIKTPVMLCHGQRDSFVPPYNALKLYISARSPKKLLFTEDAGHGMSAFVAEDKYWNSIFGFVDKFA